MMLDRANIARNPEKASALQLLYNELRLAIDNPLAKWKPRFLAFRALSECFTVILNDLMLMSSFEIYAKGVPASKGYVVHEISSPKKIENAQKKLPVRVRTIQAAIAKGDGVTFKESTMS